MAIFIPPPQADRGIVSERLAQVAQALEQLLAAGIAGALLFAVLARGLGGDLEVGGLHPLPEGALQAREIGGEAGGDIARLARVVLEVVENELHALAT